VSAVPEQARQQIQQMRTRWRRDKLVSLVVFE